MTDYTRIQIRRDSAADWTTNNPTLAEGEIGFETDKNRVKIGDGSTAWTSLRYYSAAVVDTAANFTSDNPTLEIGEIGFESDTHLFKIGDGSTAWTSLAYSSNKSVDWSAKDLLINVTGNDTATITADRMVFVNSTGDTLIKNNVSETLTLSTHKIGTELASHWYPIWFSVTENEGTITIKAAPDLSSTADADVLNSLSDSTATFQTYGVAAGDILYNTTDNTSGFVKAVSSETVLTCKDADGNDLDLFPDGNENYVIHMLSPAGVGTYRANFGMVYNNAASNLDDSGYTKPELQKAIEYSSSLDFTITETDWTTQGAFATPLQMLTFSNQPVWYIDIIATGNISADYAGLNLAISGLTFSSDFSTGQAMAGHVVDVGTEITNYVYADAGTSEIIANFDTTVPALDRFSFQGRAKVVSKPTWATRS